MKTQTPREQRILRDLIDELPRKQRDVVMLRIYAKMRYCEIGAHLGISAENAQVTFSRAKSAMRDSNKQNP